MYKQNYKICALGRLSECFFSETFYAIAGEEMTFRKRIARSILRVLGEEGNEGQEVSIGEWEESKSQAIWLSIETNTEADDLDRFSSIPAHKRTRTHRLFFSSHSVLFSHARFHGPRATRSIVQRIDTSTWMYAVYYSLRPMVTAAPLSPIYPTYDLLPCLWRLLTLWNKKLRELRLLNNSQGILRLY